ncbi:flagellin modification protein A [Vibrio profundum]|uniref:oxidoreductase n=1 Tax=Vibrio profundum TaxID=2910247 RepID=UPI003D09AD74
MEKLLENKTILVAGAGGLLGSKIIPEALKQGAKVIAADIDLESMEKRLLELGIDATQTQLTLEALDVTCESDLKSFFTRLDKVDKVDGVVNATYPRNKTYGKHFFDVSLASFNENLSLHLGSAFLFTQQCAKYFNQHIAPLSLVNISSIYGVVAPKFNVYDNTSMTMPVEYAAIKAAIQHLSKYAAAYVGDSRFRVNCVSPGGILDRQPEEFLESYRAQTHGCGMLDVEDVLGSILFLLSDQSRYMTGQNLVVDDGFSL